MQTLSPRTLSPPERTQEERVANLERNEPRRPLLLKEADRQIVRASVAAFERNTKRKHSLALEDYTERKAASIAAFERNTARVSLDPKGGALVASRHGFVRSSILQNPLGPVHEEADGSEEEEEEEESDPEDSAEDDVADTPQYSIETPKELATRSQEGTSRERELRTIQEQSKCFDKARVFIRDRIIKNTLKISSPKYHLQVSFLKVFRGYQLHTVGVEKALVEARLRFLQP